MSLWGKRDPSRGKSKFKAWGRACSACSGRAGGTCVWSRKIKSEGGGGGGDHAGARRSWQGLRLLHPVRCKPADSFELEAFGKGKCQNAGSTTSLRITRKCDPHRSHGKLFHRLETFFFSLQKEDKKLCNKELKKKTGVFSSFSLHSHAIHSCIFPSTMMIF